ncbi:META domain-containing protein [Catellatospora sp. KI3]|uniref:META domain-containing protein n=1 Tax=Catellatospora sp. KI3 TaxID=3041620 RepID=UPI002483282B|nr:META domain-containing protein [Catellatospora sp. KI3]MDI1464579.1 META domain-containing protein [Catellatospora sp. KI3]
MLSVRTPAILLTVLLAGACAQPGDVGSPGPGAGAALADRTFLSTAVTEGGTARPLVAGTRIRLMVRPDGGVSLNAGCNHISGTALFDGGRMTVGELATTEMGCDQARHEQDDWLAAFLRAGPSWTLGGDVLKLSDGRTELTMQDQESATPDRPLTGTRWTVDTVVTGEAAGSVPGGAAAYLEFADGKVSGSTGCNQLGGTAEVRGDRIVFSALRTTKMACADEVNRLERAVLAALRGEVVWKVTADRLDLTGPDRNGLSLRAG